jgi:hypothetical protein
VRSAGTVFSWILVAATGSGLHDSLDVIVQGFQLIPDDVFRYLPTDYLNQQPQSAILRELLVVKSDTTLPSRDRMALTSALKPLAVDVVTINLDLGWQRCGAGRAQPRQESSVVGYT